MNIISSILGILGLILLILIILPIIGAISSWIVLIISIVGIIFGVLSRKNSGRNLNIIVMIIALLRLWIGGGIF